MKMPGSLAWSTVMKRSLDRTLIEGHLSFLQEAAAQATAIREASEKECREHVPDSLSLLAFDACGSIFIVIHECDKAFCRGRSIPDKLRWDTRQLEDTLLEIEVFIKKWTMRGVFKRYYRKRKDQEKAAQFRQCLEKMALRFSEVPANTSIRETVEDIIYQKVHQQNTTEMPASTMQLVQKFLVKLVENEQDESTLRDDTVGEHKHESLHTKRRGQRHIRGPNATRQQDQVAPHPHKQKERSRKWRQQSCDNRAQPQIISPRITGEGASEPLRLLYCYPNRCYSGPSMVMQAPSFEYPMNSPYDVVLPMPEPWIGSRYGEYAYHAPYKPLVEAPVQNPVPPMEQPKVIESNLRKRPSSRGYTLLPTKASDISVGLPQRHSYALSEDGYISGPEDNLTSSDDSGENSSWTSDEEHHNTDSDGDGSVQELLSNDHIRRRGQFRRSAKRLRSRARSTRRPVPSRRRVLVRAPRRQRSNSSFGSFHAAEPGGSQTTLGSTTNFFSHPSSSFGSLNGSAVSFGSGPTQVTNTNSWNVHHYNIAHSFTAGERTGTKEGNSGRSRTYYSP